MARVIYSHGLRGVNREMKRDEDERVPMSGHIIYSKTGGREDKTSERERVMQTGRSANRSSRGVQGTASHQRLATARPRARMH